MKITPYINKTKWNKLKPGDKIVDRWLNKVYIIENIDRLDLSVSLKQRFGWFSYKLFHIKMEE